MKFTLKVLSLRWQQLHLRERRLAMLGALVLTAAAALAIDDWQRSEHRRLEAALPAATARLAAIQGMADEFNALASQRRNASHASTSVESVKAATAASGLALEVIPAGTHRFVVRGDVAFDDWVVWLAGLIELGWSVERAQIGQEARVAGSALSGLVSVEATLSTTEN